MVCKPVIDLRDITKLVGMKPYLQPVFPSMPLHWRCSELVAKCHIVESSELLLITGENDAIFPRFINANAIVREGCGGVEVEDEKKAGAFIDNHLVTLVFERDVCLFMK
jgi:hypothetical protein